MVQEAFDVKMKAHEDDSQLLTRKIGTLSLELEGALN